MDDGIELGNLTTLGQDPDRLLQKAIGEMSEVVIIGFRKDGSEYFASSKADAGDVLYHLDRARWNLMKMVDKLSE